MPGCHRQLISNGSKFVSDFDLEPSLRTCCFVPEAAGVGMTRAHAVWVHDSHLVRSTRQRHWQSADACLGTCWYLGSNSPSGYRLQLATSWKGLLPDPLMIGAYRPTHSQTRQTYGARSHNTSCHRQRTEERTEREGKTRNGPEEATSKRQEMSSPGTEEVLLRPEIELLKGGMQLLWTSEHRKRHHQSTHLSFSRGTAVQALTRTSASPARTCGTRRR